MKLILKYGILMGLSLVAWTMIMFATSLDTTHISVGQYFDRLVLIVPVSFTCFAIWVDIRNLGRGYTIRRGLKTGLLVNALANLIYTPFLIVYHHLINPEWLSYVLTYEKARMLTENIDPILIGNRLEMIEKSSTDANHIFGSIFFGVIVLGTVISFVATIILRKVVRKDLLQEPTQNG